MLEISACEECPFCFNDFRPLPKRIGLAPYSGLYFLCMFTKCGMDPMRIQIEYLYMVDGSCPLKEIGGLIIKEDVEKEKHRIQANIDNLKEHLDYVNKPKTIKED